MSVIRWNPLLEPLLEIDQLFTEARQLPSPRLTRGLGTSANRRFTPLADVSETGSAYFIDLELPGIAADTVEVSVHDGVLSIAGERKAPPVYAVFAEPEPSVEPSVEQETELEVAADVRTAQPQQQRRVHRAERNYGKFERRFRLPKDACLDAVEATARDGVLTVSIGRRAESARRAIEVKVA